MKEQKIYFISGVDRYQESYVYFFNNKEAYKETLEKLNEGYEYDLGYPSVYGIVGDKKNHVFSRIEDIKEGHLTDVQNAELDWLDWNGDHSDEE